MGRLDGKIAVVTGGSRGIGAAVARRLAADGAKVVVDYNASADAAEEVVAAIAKAGGEAIAVKADLLHPEELKALFKEAKHKFGRVNVLVNNAGIMTHKKVGEWDAEFITHLFDMNVRGLLMATQEAVEQFGGHGGTIINMSSSISRMAMPGTAVYTGTKGAIDVITRVLAAELGPKKITVNGLSPGFTDTDMNADFGHSERKAAIEATALGRAGLAEDIADVAAFLASDDARWITGEIIGANGGMRG